MMLRKRTRINYWSCSKFANWIRGEKKPHYLSFEGWDNWRKELKAKHSWRYWFAEEFLDTLQNIVYFPGDLWWSIQCEYRNRFVNHTHALVSKLPRGEWYDMDTRILHCLFDAFCYEFCEGEIGGRSGKKNEKGKEGFYRYVAWAENSVNEEYPCPDHQIEAAKQFRELYEWWTIHRPNRKDPMDFYEEKENKNPISHYLDKKQRYKQAEELEEQYEKEDTEKLIKLIELRGSMWT
jgi:hypothetical protein